MTLGRRSVPARCWGSGPRQPATRAPPGRRQPRRTATYPAGTRRPLDRSIHGEAFAGIGTGGYREGGVTACAPLGRNAAVAVSIDAARLGR